MKGKVFSVSVSSEKGTKKKAVSWARFIADWGIEGDAHAGKWHRQVSLLPVEEVNKFREELPGLKPGDFAENIVTQGIDFDKIRLGDRILIGKEIVLEVSQIGKTCHVACEIQKLTGKCIMPQKGVFARVLKGGLLKKGLIIQTQPALTSGEEKTKMSLR